MTRVEDIWLQTGRDLCALGFSVGKYTDDVRHVDPCDCDLDEETIADRCLENSVWCWALLKDEGAHGWSLAYELSQYHAPPGALPTSEEVKGLLAMGRATDA